VKRSFLFEIQPQRIKKYCTGLADIVTKTCMYTWADFAITVTGTEDDTPVPYLDAAT